MFSIIIPIHNKLPHLERSINSVLLQTFEKFELLLIDDASTDGSSDKILEFNDSRIKILRRETAGPGGYAARNLGIEKAKYEWISFLDADDEWELDYLNEVNEKHIKYNDVEIITCNWDNIYPRKVVTNEYFNKIKEAEIHFDLIDFFYHNRFVWTSATTLKKKLIIQAGLFPADKCKRGGDMDTWIRCLELSKGNLWINQTLAHYHKETVNQVTDNKLNPSINFCALNTIKEIRLKTKNTLLLKAIDAFCARHVYNMLSRDLSMERMKKESLLKLIDSKFLRNKVNFILKIKKLIG